MADPEPVGPPICDQLTGVYAAYGILGGLVSRSLRGGQGQKLEISMLAAGVAFQPAALAGYLMEGEVADKTSRAHGSQSYAFAGSDGLPFAIHLSSPQKFWQGLCDTVGHPEMATDARFHPKIRRIDNYDLLRDILQGYFSARPRAEWLAELEKHDVPAGPIYTVPEMLADPQVQHNRLVRTFGEGPRSVDLLGFPVQYLATPSTPDLPPPLLGEHNAEVYARLGLDEDDLARLKAEGAI
jgi:crotonobetainyl-CoA:carnitine CoA-transferase CaiB-like acyl-CoA transferase